MFAAFVALFSIADTPFGLFGLRTAAEIGQAAAVIGALTIVNDIAPEDRRGEAYSIYSLSSWAGVGLGPVVGDVVLRTVSYEAVWFVSAGLAVVGAVFAIALPETRRPAAAGSTRVAFLNRSALLPGSILVCEMFALASLMVFSALYARQLGMAGAGLVLLTNAAVLVSIRIFGRRLPDRLGVYRASIIGVFSAALGPAIPALYPEPLALYLGAAAFGVGHAFLYPALFMLAVGRAPERERSAALGTVKACEAAGFAAAAAALGVTSALIDYQGAFAVASLVTAVAFVPLLYMARQRATPTLRPDARTS
jgi:predicted MFS family arabinose efflux permease